ncbi:MAG: YHS domain protein [Pararhodobacter sp.]|nr:YHS domain protein [Pararhodobacter sp.]
MRQRRAFLAAVVAFALSPGAMMAQEIFTDQGMALRGYDAVAYFTVGEARAGSEDWTVDWGGAEWRFVSEANRDAFLAAPEDYAPQYGGFCAWAMSQGYRAPINPHAWTVVEGRLYLNASTRVHRRWTRDMEAHIERADANWPELRD